MDTIINKVANSGLINIDLEKLYPVGNRIVFDLKENLWQGQVLKEKDFRTFITTNDWSIYKDKYVAIVCSTNAIIPVWAYMLLASVLLPFTKQVVFGSKNELEKEICKLVINNLDLSIYQNKRVIIKGCSNIPNSEYAMVELTKKMQAVVKSLMFGEACSTVPIYKNNYTQTK